MGLRLGVGRGDGFELDASERVDGLAEEAADCEGEAEGAGAGVDELVCAGRRRWEAGYGFAGYTGMTSYSMVNRFITNMYVGFLSLVEGLAFATTGPEFQKLRNLGGYCSAIRGQIIMALITTSVSTCLR